MLVDTHEYSVYQALSKYEFHFLPVFNIDGYKYTFTYGHRLWRKTRTRYGFCYGADPNRNWDSHWEAGYLFLFVLLILVVKAVIKN